MKFSIERSGAGPLGKYFFLGVLFAGGMIILVQMLLPSFLQIQCLFRRWTGLPCPICGSTRCAQMVIEGEFLSAWRMQPLAFVGLFLWVGALVYSLVALLFRLPAVRIRLERRVEYVAVAGLLVLPVLLNWLYLIWRG